MASPAPEFEFASCLAQAKERCTSLVDTTNSLTGWTLSTTSGIPASMKIYERRDDTSMITVRGEIDGIKAPAYDVAKWINSLESLPILDKMAQAANAKLVEEFGMRSCVMYCPYNVPWPLDTRDFLWFQHWESLNSGEEILYGFSVTRKDVPEKKGHVRGLIRDSGYAIRPTSETTCRISYIVCVDPMGWVPAWANTKTAEQAFCLDFAKQYFDKNPITVSSKPPTEAGNDAAASAPPPGNDATASTGNSDAGDQETSPSSPNASSPQSVSQQLESVAIDENVDPLSGAAI